MIKELIKKYIEAQPVKVVSIDWDKNTLKYEQIKQC